MDLQRGCQHNQLYSMGDKKFSDNEIMELFVSIFIVFVILILFVKILFF